MEPHLVLGVELIELWRSSFFFSLMLRLRKEPCECWLGPRFRKGLPWVMRAPAPPRFFSSSSAYTRIRIVDNN